MHAEVFEHVEDGLEPQVLHATLPVAVYRHAKVLCATCELRKKALSNCVSVGHT